MALIRFLAAATALVASPAMAADTSPQTQSEAAPASPSTPNVPPRKLDRTRQAPGGRSPIFDAPGAAVLLIPAAWFTDGDLFR